MRIAIDAGHGSNTAGKRTPPMPYNISFYGDGVVNVKKGESIREHTANVHIAYLLVKELERCGLETFFSGFNDNNPYDDEDIPLSVRQKAIVAAKCDYSISIHFNAYGDGKAFNSAEGVEIYIHNQHSKASDKFAATILKHLVKGSTQKNRGVTKQALAMCNCNSLNVKGAILIETAFMTNEKEATSLMGSAKFWKETSVKIAQGICEYLGVSYIPESVMPSKTITKDSKKEDIKWLQKGLNQCLTEKESFIPLAEDGIFGNKTRIAVLIYWEKLGWNKEGVDTGWKAGKATINALYTKRKQ